MPNEDDEIRQIDLGENPGNKLPPLTKEQKRFISFLEGTLIPDLKKSESDNYAVDFEAAVRYIKDPYRGKVEVRSADAVASFEDADHMISYLRETIGPDTKESGMVETADDLFTAADMIEDRMCAKNPGPGKCDQCGQKPCACDGGEEEENPSGKLHEAKKKVAALGLTLVHDVEYNEFIVKEKGSRNDSDTSYHTDNLDDAVVTAAKMAEQLGLDPQENPAEEEEECGCFDDCKCDPCNCEECDVCEEDEEGPLCSCCCDCEDPGETASIPLADED